MPPNIRRVGCYLGKFACTVGREDLSDGSVHLDHLWIEFAQLLLLGRPAIHDQHSASVSQHTSNSDSDSHQFKPI